MYKKILNPETGNHVSIFSNVGQTILHNYVEVYQYGGADVDEKEEQVGAPRTGPDAPVFDIFGLDICQRNRKFSKQGKAEFADMLVNIKNGGNINEQDGLGQTALFYAIVSGCVELVRYLIDNGASYKLQNEYGVTALDIASMYKEEYGELYGHDLIYAMLFNKVQ